MKILKLLVIMLIVMSVVTLIADEFKSGDIVCQVIKDPERNNYNKLINCKRIVDVKKKKYLFMIIENKNFKIEQESKNLLKKYIKVN